MYCTGSVQNICWDIIIPSITILVKLEPFPFSTSTLSTVKTSDFPFGLVINSFIFVYSHWFISLALIEAFKKARYQQWRNQLNLNYRPLQMGLMEKSEKVNSFFYFFLHYVTKPVVLCPRGGHSYGPTYGMCRPLG